MKNVVLVAATALLTTGMMFASSSGVLPGVMPSKNPTGFVSTASYVLPGVQSTQETPNVGLGSGEERPGVGVQTGERGSVSPHSSFLPGTEANETLQSLNR